MITTLQTAPTEEPITRAAFKEHARISINDDDEYIDWLIKAVRIHIEETYGLALITQTWKLYLSDWPQGNYIKIPYPPLQSLTTNAIKYRDSDYTEYSMDSDDYRVLTNVMPGRIVLDYGATWPSETLIGNSEAIYIEFKAGFGDDRTDVPADIRHACLIACSELYENREDKLVGQTVTDLKIIDRLLAKYQRMWWGL